MLVVQYILQIILCVCRWAWYYSTIIILYTQLYDIEVSDPVVWPLPLLAALAVVRSHSQQQRIQILLGTLHMQRVDRHLSSQQRVLRIPRHRP